MSYFKEKYKCKTAGFSNITMGRRIRASDRRERSKNDRDDIFNQRRNVKIESQIEGSQVAPVKESRLTRLQKWQAERDKHRKQEKYKIKKPFVVGIMHHKLYSPINQETPVVSKNIRPTVPKRITRATEKRLVNKAVAQKNNVRNTVKDPTSKSTDIKNEGKDEKSFAPKDYMFKPPNGLPRIPLFGRVVLESMSPVTLNVSALGKNSSVKKTRSSIMERRKNTPKAVRLKLSFNGDDDNKNEKVKTDTRRALRSRDSSREERNSRKENQSKLDVTIDDTISLNTSYTLVKEGEYTADYYQLLLNDEVAKLNEMCQKWREIKAKSGITRDERYEINETICQTNFVINHKLERFRGFIVNCKSGGMFVKCEDLQELWDMACVHVKDCVRRFEKLEELHLRGRQEQEPLTNRSIGKKTPMKKKSIQ